MPHRVMSPYCIVLHHVASLCATSCLSSSLSSCCSHVSYRLIVASCPLGASRHARHPIALCFHCHVLFKVVDCQVACPRASTSLLVTRCQHRRRRPCCSSSPADAVAKCCRYLQWPPDTPPQTPLRRRHLPKPLLYRHEYLIVA